MTLAESLGLSEFQLSHLQNGYHEWMNLMWLWGLRGEGVWYTHGTRLMVATIIITVARVAPQSLLCVLRAHYLIPKH